MSTRTVVRVAAAAAAMSASFALAGWGGPALADAGTAPAGAHVSNPPAAVPDCGRLLARIQLVATQADLFVGATLPGPASGGGPQVWAAELRRVDPALAGAFRPVHSERGMRDAVMALTASAAAALQSQAAGGDSRVCMVRAS